MKKDILLMITLIFLFGIFNSCDEMEEKKMGYVTFGANYHIIDCISNVTIYIDNEKVGTLTNFTDTIVNCGEESNITKELTVGYHSYMVDIRPETGTGCTKEVNGTFTVSENECEKIFIDYWLIQW